MGLAMMRGGRAITNRTLRNLGLDPRRATVELGDLVNRGLAVRVGERRHARYFLASSASDTAEELEGATPPMVNGASDREAAVLAAMPIGGLVTRHDIQQATDLPQAAVLRILNVLVAAGRVDAVGPARSPARRYRRLR
jgi:ATP-dependent DNA helicase RecG